MSERAFDIFADYFQFLVMDAHAHWEDLADRWTEKAVNDMFIQGEGWIAIGTARNMKVPVTVKTYAGEPELDPAEWDRIVLGSLFLRSGELVVTGLTDNEISGGRIQLDSGYYKLRALFAGLSSLSPDGLSGDDRYVIELWPVSQSGPIDPVFLKP
jgi:hypothetical protein